MKATDEDYKIFWNAFRGMSKKPESMTESQFIWNCINCTNVLMYNRHLYERLNDDNIQAVAKKALKNLNLL